MAKHILIVVTNDLVTDQRVARIADTLNDKGYLITLVGRVLSNSLPIEKPYSVKRFRLWFNKGPLFYANYNFRLFFYLLFKQYDALLANDLDTLLGGFFASRIRYKKLVYDSHEYFTEVPELINRKFQQRIWLFIERLILPKINFAYTVSESIAQEYKLKYNTSFAVIRNLPARRIIKSRTPENVIIYQGALNVGRGIELMIETMKYIDNYSLWIVGSGDIDAELKKNVAELNIEDRVKFYGRIPMNELDDITSQAKLGLSFEEDLGLNYRYALPNKLFDYIQANIPVLVSDLPEMKKVVTEYAVGETLASRDPEKIALQINEMLSNIEKQSMWKIQLEKAAYELCWENEKPKLLNIFDKAMPLL